MPQCHYTQLSQEKRAIIEEMLGLGCSQTDIAKELRCNKSTISREIRRNGIKNKNIRSRVNKPSCLDEDNRHYRGTLQVDINRKRKEDYRKRLREFKNNKAHYSAEKAERKCNNRKTRAMQKCHPIKLQSDSYLTEIIIGCLKIRWSPEQISLRLSLLNTLLILLGSPPLLPSISHETIYSFIYRQPKEKRKEMMHNLRRKGKRYRHNRSEKYNQTDRSKHSIHDRPDVVNELDRLGDLEGDTIVGKDKKDRLLTHTERITGIVTISRIIGFNAHKVCLQSKRDIERVFKGEAKTVTYDNGIEFILWMVLQKLLDNGFTVYFADPYTPSQRGRNENANGLIRDYLPKGTDFKLLTDGDIMKVETLLNNRPRKRLGGLTPLEAWELLHLTV